ncbi:hypothetical protein [Hyperthermus butylicus]|uniref:Uncharacterized protein n=1 Tax=Hyperthermus butylicus (strain DSM 5456 / JCM 9403 / PLM1-5) TaxID=415426 RepID=A2BJB1_HYPBU|nr:hypothetical protein [Hyperthermus butylicus]ABM80072.1 hypothetical protein Hbut_0200 [Hyperthermus butylicus DSM 5456]
MLVLDGFRDLEAYRPGVFRVGIAAAYTLLASLAVTVTGLAVLWLSEATGVAGFEHIGCWITAFTHIGQPAGTALMYAGLWRLGSIVQVDALKAAAVAWITGVTLTLLDVVTVGAFLLAAAYLLAVLGLTIASKSASIG